MDHVAVERALQNQSLTANADEVAAVCEDLRRLEAAMDEIDRSYADLPAAPAFANLIARGESARMLLPDQQESIEPARDGIPQCLARVEQAQAATNAFISIFAEQAPQAESRLGLVRQSGPLTGVAFAYKDVFVSRTRWPTVGVGHRHAWKGPPSALLARLEALGAVPVGATNLDPHCYTSLGLNRDFGRVLNPHGSAYSVGGSSSGSAAAVATGAVPFALGTDTGGSIRIPAALCGVYGLKPTQGVLADSGIAPLSISQDNPGIFAGEIKMLRHVFGALAKNVSPDENNRSSHSHTRNLSRVSVGIDVPNLCYGMDEQVEACFRRMVRRIENLGARVVRVKMPSVEHLNTLASVLTSFEAANVHRVALSSRPEFYPAPVRRRLLTAVLVEQRLYERAIGLRAALLQHALARVFSQVRIVICPTLRKIAQRVDNIPEDDVVRAGSIGIELLRLNRPFSYLGLPALSVPAGMDGNGIPIGLQLIGRPYGEGDLFTLARALEEQAEVAIAGSQSDMNLRPNCNNPIDR
jgi:aspartyl-tRNA(Asn)/glutamyl-tRNA(Gln) amidotransferase subunit A